MESESGGYAREVATFLYEHPKGCVGFVVVATLTAVVLATNLRIASGLSSFFHAKPELEQTLEEVREEFDTDESIYLLYETDDVFGPESLRTLRLVENRLAEIKVSDARGKKLEPIREITSLASIDVLVGSEMKFRTEPLVPSTIPGDDESLERIRERARANPIIREMLLPEEGDGATAIVARLENEIDDTVRSSTVESVRRLLDELQKKGEIVGDFSVTGRPVVRTDLVRFNNKDLRTYGPLSFLIMGILFMVFFRRFRGMIWAVIGLQLAVTLAMGVLGVAYGKMTVLTATLVPLASTLTAPILLHFYTEYGHCARKFQHREAVLESTATLLVPVSVTSLTTAIAFGALATSEITTINKFGLTAGITLILMFFVLTALCVTLFRRYEADQLIGEDGLALSDRFEAALEATGSFVHRHAKGIVAVSLVLSGLLCYGMTRIEVGHNNLAFFPESSEIRQATDRMRRELGGSVPMTFWVRHSKKHRFTEPENIARVHKFREYLKERSDIARVTDFSQFVKYMHRQFWNGDPEEYRIPDTQQQVRQLLVLNTDDRIYEYLNQGGTEIRILVRSNENDVREVHDIFMAGEAKLRSLFPEDQGYEISGAGRNKKTSKGTSFIFQSQLRSLIVGFVAIFLALLVLFRSWKMVLLAIWPNSLPVLFGLGVMGWAGIQLNTPLVLFAAITLGIAVDDTVHYLTALRRSFERHQDHLRAIRDAIQKKGPAIVGTTVVLTCGFSVYLVSNFSSTRHFGWVISSAMIVAMLADLLLLPALVLWFKPGLAAKGSGDSEEK